MARQTAINGAGLAASVGLGHLLMLDGTPPLQPVLKGCQFGGTISPMTGTYYQTSEEGLAVCLASVPGFADDESGIWYLEWQLARWVATPSGGVWSTLTPTQYLREDESSEVNEHGVLHLTAHTLSEATGGFEVPGKGRYRLGLRAVNRAGLRSCPIGISCNSVVEEGYDSDWAARLGVEITVDMVPPSCVKAQVWLTDPSPSCASVWGAGDANRCPDIMLNAPPFGASNVASGGMQGDMSHMGVQWEGFDDYDSGIGYCDISVIEFGNTNPVALGERCSCTGLRPEPVCNCARDPAGLDARCEIITPLMKKHAASLWRPVREAKFEPPRGDPKSYCSTAIMCQRQLPAHQSLVEPPL